MGTFSTDTADSPFRAEHARILAGLARPAAAPPAAPSPADLAERYEPAVREAARRVWAGRMLNEHRSSAVFAALVPQLIEANSTIDAQTVALRMAQDEIHHAALCGRVVEAFGGEARVDDGGPLMKMPEHPGLAPLERVMRNAAFVGCLSETVAVALVTEEREQAREPIVRATLDQVLGDEVMHARFGWLFLARALDELGDAARARTGEYLRVAFAYLERREIALLPLTPPEAGELREQREAVGVCEGSDARELFYETLRSVIVPRFEDLGVPAARAWRERTEAR